MKITIHTLEGRSIFPTLSYLKLEISLEVEASEKLEEVKIKLEKYTGISPEHQCLLFDGKQLREGSHGLRSHSNCRQDACTLPGRGQIRPMACYAPRGRMIIAVWNRGGNDDVEILKEFRS